MKIILFGGNPYAYGILNPIKNELVKQNDPYMWFIPENLVDDFPFKDTDKYTTSIKEVVDFRPDANFVPGNQIPHYIRGVKVQVFHGFAGEKKGHFRIRDYFDLYLTQGPFFTQKFNDLKIKHKNFEVVETGWPKLDPFAEQKSLYNAEKKQLLEEIKAKTIILYAPTFSPSLTSAPVLIEEIEKLSKNSEYLILIKFHDLMNKDLANAYEELSKRFENIKVIKAHNILKLLIMSDLMISDTSSVIYEFLLMNKPVISFKNNSSNIRWDDFDNPSELSSRVQSNLEEDLFKSERQNVFETMHPYHDGRSAQRMVEATKAYIVKHGVPDERKLSFLRKYKIYKSYGRI